MSFLLRNSCRPRSFCLPFSMHFPLEPVPGCLGGPAVQRLMPYHGTMHAVRVRTVSFSAASLKPRRSRLAPQHMSPLPVPWSQLSAKPCPSLQLPWPCLSTCTSWSLNVSTINSCPLPWPCPPTSRWRGPSLQEILAADRSVWQSVHALTRDQSWSLSDSLNEIAFCRQDMSSALQPRPRAQHAPQPRIPVVTDPSVPPPPVPSWGTE